MRNTLPYLFKASERERKKNLIADRKQKHPSLFVRSIREKEKTG